MVPLKLELTNFLSYRQTATLDFTGLHDDFQSMLGLYNPEKLDEALKEYDAA